MIQRCENPNVAGYQEYYGGCGVTVCPQWKDFAVFYADVGPRPSPTHSIDRYPNNDGNYEPGNVRWATPKQQVENRRNVLTPEKVAQMRALASTKTRRELAEMFGCCYTTVKSKCV